MEARGHCWKVAQEHPNGVNIWRDYEGLSVGDKLWLVCIRDERAAIWLEYYPIYTPGVS